MWSKDGNIMQLEKCFLCGSEKSEIIHKGTRGGGGLYRHSSLHFVWVGAVK